MCYPVFNRNEKVYVLDVDDSNAYKDPHTKIAWGNNVNNLTGVNSNAGSIRKLSRDFFDSIEENQVEETEQRPIKKVRSDSLASNASTVSSLSELSGLIPGDIPTVEPEYFEDKSSLIPPKICVESSYFPKYIDVSPIRQAGKASLNSADYSEFVGSEENFHQMSHKLVNTLRKNHPELFYKLDSLATTDRKKWNAVKRQGWNQLKKKLATKMESQKLDGGKNYEDFRGEVIKAVEAISVGTLKEMGYADPGGHLASGTAGWNSDIDTVFSANSGIPEKIQVFEKLLFDMLIYTTFDDLPGVVFDTESYLDHTGSAFETIEKIETLQGKKSLSFMEMNAYHLQMLRQCGGNGKAWNKFVDIETGNVRLAFREGDVDASHMTAVYTSLGQVMKLQSDIEKGVEKLVKKYSKTIDDPAKAKRLAMMEYKSNRLITLSTQMDEVKERISLIEEENPDLDDLDWGARREFEGEHLKLAFLGLLRTSFFDEGYNTQGAFNKTCLRQGGQIHSTMINRRRQRVTTEYLKRGSTLRQSIFQKSPISRKHETKANPQEEMSSMKENLAMYRGHLVHKFISKLPKKRRYLFRSLSIDSSEDLELIIKRLRRSRSYSMKEINRALQSAFVQTSKYSERSLDSANSLMEFMVKSGYEKEAKALKGSMRVKVPYFRGPRNIYDLSKELELLKRQKVLNKTGFKSYLEGLSKEMIKHIGIKEINGMIPLQKRSVRRSKAKLSGFGGNDTLFVADCRTNETVMRDLSNFLYGNLKHLQDKMKVEDSVRNEDIFFALKSLFPERNRKLSNKIDVILKAATGYRDGDQKSDEKAKKLIRKQRSNIVVELGFRDYAEILKFNNKLTNFVRDVDRFALETGVVETAKEPIGLSLPELWNNTNDTLPRGRYPLPSSSNTILL